MDEKEMKAAVTKAEDAAKALQPHADFRTNLKTALGKDHEGLAEDPAQLAQLAVAGKGALAAMVDDLVAADRQKGALGDAKEEVDEAKAAYAALPFKQLQRLHASATKAAAGGTTDAGKPALRGGDPNNTGGEKAASLPEGSLFANPLIGG